MPVSGNEEPGVLARQASSLAAGVPIKKRRYPLIQPAPSPPQESSSGAVENDMVQNKDSIPGQSFSLSHANVAASSPGRSDAINKSVLDIKKETNSLEKFDTDKNSFPEFEKENPSGAEVSLVQSNACLSSGKPQEHRTAVDSESMENVDNKEKIPIGNFADQTIPGNTELHVAHDAATAVNVGKEVLSRQQVEREHRLEFSIIPGNAELSLGLKKPFAPAPAPAGQNSGENFQAPENVDISSLSLSLGKGEAGTQSKSGQDDAIPNANRSNWDLNTTMDAWEGSGTVHGTMGVDVLNETSGTHDVKPFMSSAGMYGAVVDTKKKVLYGLGQQAYNFTVSSMPPSQSYKSENALNLSLGASFCQTNCSSEHPGSSAEVDSGRVPISKLIRVHMNSVGHRTVKSDPFEENAKHDYAVDIGKPIGLLDFKAVKREPVQEKGNIESTKLSSIGPQKLVECKSIKSEPVQEDNQERHRTIETSSQQYLENIVQRQNNHSSSLALPSTPRKSCASGVPTCSGLSISGDAANQSDDSFCNKEVTINMGTSQEDCRSIDHVVTESLSKAEGHRSEESTAFDSRIDSYRAHDSNANDPARGSLNVMDELHLESHGNGEGSASDEEKINISTDLLEEDSYGSDCDSEGGQCGREDYEYEDGEVREPLADGAIEGPMDEEREADNANHGVYDNKNVVSISFSGDGNIVQSQVPKEDGKIEDHEKMSEDHIKECVDTVVSDKTGQIGGEDGSLLESSVIKVLTAGVDDKKPMKVTESQSLDQSGEKNVQQDMKKEASSDGTASGNQVTMLAVGKFADASTRLSETTGKTESNLPKTEVSLNGNDVAKGVNNGSNKSRIINLPRASNVTSPSRTRSIQGRSYPSRTGRERYTDFEGEKLHARGNRDENYTDGPRKFVRERIHDRSFRNSRLNFVRGRGRLSSRLDTIRGEWESDRDFVPELYNGPSDYRFSRHKRASGVTDVDIDCNGYMIDPDGPVVGAGRGARKHLNDDLPSFRHQSSRRLSPGGRDGPATRGIQMIRRIPRNISPSRGTGEDVSELVGLRHTEKVMRAMQDDVMDSVFTHPQPPYDELDSQFVRGNRNFSSLQRRGVSRIRSKSPVMSRTRSPGPWSSRRRRSPDGFNGLPQLPHRRSPAFYRKERVRSPDHPCFPEEIMSRRCGSPPYVGRASSDLKDMDSGRDRGHPRSVIPNRRSPSDRVLPRNNRRFDMLDHRERADSDEYFGGPMRSGRFHELGGDGTPDERRKCGERQGLVRSFRPPYSGADDENFRFHLEDGPRSFRFRPESDSEFMERSNLREREFDRRVKTGRERDIDEQEESYRQRGQVWHDDGFDDVSRMKRRRF